VQLVQRQNRWVNCGSIRQHIFLFVRASRPTPVLSQPPTLRAPGGKALNWPLTSSYGRDKNEGSYTSTPTTCFHDIIRDFIRHVPMLFIYTFMDVSTSLLIYSAVNVRLNTQGILEYWSSYLISCRQSVPISTQAAAISTAVHQIFSLLTSLPSSPPPIHHKSSQ